MPLRQWNLHFFWGFLLLSQVIQVNLKLKVEVFFYRIFTPEPTAIRVALRDCARRCRNGISLREELRCTRGRRAGAPGREGSGGGGGTVPGVGSGGGDIGEEELEEAAATHHAKRSEE